jgi:hypothetical protein
LSVVVALALTGVVLVRQWPRSGATAHGGQPVLSVPPLNPPPDSPTSVQPTLAPWPTADSTCDGNVQLPIVTSSKATERTGLHILVSGGSLSSVDFDARVVTPVPHVSVPSGEYVVSLAQADATYAVTDRCGIAGPNGRHIVRIAADGRTRMDALRLNGIVIFDETSAWSVRYPDDPHELTGSVSRLASSKRVALPADFAPVGVSDGVLVGNASGSADGRGAVELVDPSTGAVREQLDRGQVLAVGSGVVVWTVGCDISLERPCNGFSRRIAGGPVTRFALPRPPGPALAAVSRDGRQLAFTLENPSSQSPYDQGHPLPPVDIAVAHLDTGVLEVVPGIELPTKVPPGVAFSPDGRWLVMALNAGTKTRVLAWRHGLPQPLETTCVRGATLQAAVLVR